MKKLAISAAIAALSFSGASFADSGPGCGLGTQIFKGQSGLFAHTLAATTNGAVSWNQYFGLTSGTLECDQNSVVSNEFQREIFVASNLDNISQELARGSGDHLRSLAALFEIHPEDQTHFIDVTRQQLPDILNSSLGAKEILATLDRAMTDDPTLSKYVQ